MNTQKALSLARRFELLHTPLPYSGRLMGLLCPIILILFGAVDRFWNQFPLSNAIAAQFIGNDLPGLAAMASQ
jgi:hypothetical protein